MRYLSLSSLLLAATFCGCKTTHIALAHPGLGFHVVAKFEANDTQFAAANFENEQLAHTSALRR